MFPYQPTLSKLTKEYPIVLIGLGGAGCNILQRCSLTGIEHCDTVAIDTDIRPLKASQAMNNIQLGEKLTRGLGTRGDLDLGKQAAQEAEGRLNAIFIDKKILFLCVGLGGGTGSGAAPYIARLARQEGLFVVVLATIPFPFEGKRLTAQANTSLSQLDTISNALITFENARMGELILEEQGIHEAFMASYRLISEAISSLYRLVSSPGLIYVGLDDLMEVLHVPESRALFGTGQATGKNRVFLALEKALASPLLDKGKLLKNAANVLIHIAGGKSLSLAEVSSLMDNIGDLLPPTAHIFFGVSTELEDNQGVHVSLISAISAEHAPPVTLTIPEHDIRPETSFLEEGQHPEKKPLTEEESQSLLTVSEGFTRQDDTLPDEPLPPQPSAQRDADSFLPPEEEDEEEATIEISQNLLTDPFEQTIQKEKEHHEEVFTIDKELVEDTPPDPVTLHQPQSPFFEEDEIEEETAQPSSSIEEDDDFFFASSPQKKTLQSQQTEFNLSSKPKGRFEGISPNLYGNADLDIPPSLR